jgi:uncharacterized protein DUF262
MHRFLNNTIRSISWFRKTFNANELEMRPPFQRNPVWTSHQKSYLIDSILNEYPIPELYMQGIVDPEGREKHIVVDGQQRIRACLEFIEGKYALESEDSPDWADMFFEELSPQDKKKLFEYSFVVRLLPDMPEDQLRAIFQRLNRNVVILNQQELRHATYWGPFIKTMEKISEHEFWGQSGVFSANDVRRMIDTEFISELTIGILHGPQNKKQSLDDWYETYEKGFEDQSDIENAFNAVLGEVSMILPNLSKTRWKKKSDFYTLFLVFAKHKDSLPLSREKRQEAGEILNRFGQDVSDLLTDLTQAERYSEQVANYSKGVERAASDLANRKKRLENLETVLAPVW